MILMMTILCCYCNMNVEWALFYPFILFIYDGIGLILYVLVLLLQYHSGMDPLLYYSSVSLGLSIFRW